MDTEPFPKNTLQTFTNMVIMDMQADSREFWLAYRQALLLQIDAIERRLGMFPTTADIRKQAKTPVAN